MSLNRIANGLTFILLLLCALLVVVIYQEWLGVNNDIGSSDAAGNKQTDLRHDGGVLNSIEQTNIALSQFAEILNRPLFVQGRTPYEEEQQDSSTTPLQSPLKLTLEGVVLSPTSRVAVVRDLTNNNILRLSVGMVHNGWRVKSVQAQTVEFERGEEAQSIKIELSSKTAENQPAPAIKLPVNRKGQTNIPRR